MDELAAQLVPLGISPEIVGRLSAEDRIPSKGMRNFGAITLYGWPLMLERARDLPELIEAGMLALGNTMDGRLVVVCLEDLSVGYLDQFDPDYPKVIFEVYVSLELTLEVYLKTLYEEGSQSLPADYEEALHRAGREFRGWD